MTKICPLMSRPSPHMNNGYTDFRTKEGSGYTLMKVPCLEDDCQFWEEACDQNDCKGCDYESDFEDGNDCPGKTGYCKYVDSMEGQR